MGLPPSKRSFSACQKTKTFSVFDWADVVLSLALPRWRLFQSLLLYLPLPTFWVWLNRCWSILDQDQGCLRSGCRSAQVHCCTLSQRTGCTTTATNGRRSALLSSRPFATCCFKCCSTAVNRFKTFPSKFFFKKCKCRRVKSR